MPPRIPSVSVCSPSISASTGCVMHRIPIVTTHGRPTYPYPPCICYPTGTSTARSQSLRERWTVALVKASASPRISRSPQLQSRKNYLTEKDSFPSQIPIVVIKQTSPVQPRKTKESGWLPYHHRILTLRTTSRILLPPLPRVCTVCAHTMPSQNVGFLFS
ncbi:hypothetical protein B9Z19DRAFT_1075543 [Tuber borchii]|uniref:Uncharacterized protein n=1 Tax=Tuber borchii TaxID=42251 RepID=A0A2T7A398_TUBBO|nr:hypothetical protein B9Z19DRAFT_1075543 [Tuber borchii]